MISIDLHYHPILYNHAAVTDSVIRRLQGIKKWTKGISEQSELCQSIDLINVNILQKKYEKFQIRGHWSVEENKCYHLFL